MIRKFETSKGGRNGAGDPKGEGPEFVRGTRRKRAAGTCVSQSTETI